MPFDRPDQLPFPRRPRRAWRRLPGWAWALLVCVLCLGATGWFALGERARALHEANRAFASDTDRIAAGIQGKLDACEHLIRAFQSVFMASDEVTPVEFARVYANLEPDARRTSLQALAYAERQPRADGDHFVTTMFAPAAGNEVILGLDVVDQPSNLKALVDSRDHDRIEMSAPFRLRQSGDGARAVDGFILRLPVYTGRTTPVGLEQRRALLSGSIGASFRIADLIAAAMPDDAATVGAVQVRDVTGGGDHLLYASGSFADAARPGDVLVREIRFGGRTWRIDVRRAEALAGAGAWRDLFWLGTVISLLLAALTWSLVSTRERAITLGVAMSERYRASEERFRKLNELLPTLVLVARRDDGRIVYRNAAARARLPGETDEGRLSDLLDADALAKLCQDGDEPLRSADVEMHDAAGRAFWASAWVAPIEIDDDAMWLVVASDISEQRRLTERLSYQASHDSLTRLLNRREFEARIQELLAQSPRRAGALLFIDLDQFKLINDTSGHRAGDELLVQLASMMREQLRPNDLLGRLGGDEFGVLLSGVGTVESAMLAAERLRRSLEAFVFTWEQRTYMVSASIGAVMLSGASTLKEVFAHADAACYLAKEGGRNRVHFHSEDDAAVTRRLTEMEWANKLRDAVRDGRLLLDYQELLALQEGGMPGVHVELLLRLREEDGRVVLPGAFLPAAERYGLMPMIDRWVLQAALAHLDHLHPAGRELATCAINLSSASLEDEQFVDFVDGLLAAHGVDPGRVVFEVTETVAMRNFVASSQLLSRLRGLGCKVALDDFGAGMSSFGYLKNLELDMVKIDGSFVQGLEHDRMSQSIVRAVTEIGHQQGLAVIAEWVSSPAMLAILRTMGVDYAQGFTLHVPERVVYQRGSAG
jgi:diguanylate cyclase (GGDEF)-like protein